MSERTDYSAVIHAIITLAHNLKISVTAEGIETAAQLAQLQALDCDHGQGYNFAKPMASDVAESYIINRMPLTQAG
jgi:EAL domain-containing protein (putative c-di-GMP-specific phosphodiesterase class I)